MDISFPFLHGIMHMGGKEHEEKDGKERIWLDQETLSHSKALDSGPPTLSMD